MKSKMVMLIGVVAVSLIAYLVVASNGSSTPDGNQMDQAESVKELVQQYSANNKANETASITSKQLIVTDSNGSKEVYDLSDEEFFVSIAPYINQTHP